MPSVICNGNVPAAPAAGGRLAQTGDRSTAAAARLVALAGGVTEA